MDRKIALNLMRGMAKGGNGREVWGLTGDGLKEGVENFMALKEATFGVVL